MGIGALPRDWRFEVALALAFSIVLVRPALVTDRMDAMPRPAIETPTPAARVASYRLNGRVRPFLFWIGRDNVGEAFITWRHVRAGRRGFELLIGTDPARAPRDINRWGFIVEELGEREATVLGLMKESDEQTLEEAEAKVARKDRASIFKAARTRVVGQRAETDVMTITAPPDLTYRDLEALLLLMADAPAKTRSTDIPVGTQQGFLAAMDVLIRASLDACGRPNGAGAQALAAVPYLYNQTLYDLMLASCTYEPALDTRMGTVADVVDGRFRLRNRTTKHDTRFRVVYGTSGEYRELPIRAVFRPRWWMEVEMEIESVLDKDGRASTPRFISRGTGQ